MVWSVSLVSEVTGKKQTARILKITNKQNNKLKLTQAMPRRVRYNTLCEEVQNKHLGKGLTILIKFELPLLL